MRWGDRQVPIYQEVLDKALLSLLTHPDIGHKRPDLSPDYRALRAGQHFIVYRISGQVSYVIRVLHERMDFRGHLQ